MDAKEFNKITADCYTAKLKPLGFKKKGTSFYLHRPPNIMVLQKNTMRGFFYGFTLAFTHDFLSKSKDKNGKLKIPGYLEDYPISISLPALKNQYKLHNSCYDFDYELNFLNREVNTTRHNSESDFTEMVDIPPEPTDAEIIINEAINVVLADGMKLFKEFSPALSLHVLTKYENEDDFIIEKFVNELIQFETKK